MLFSFFLHLIVLPATVQTVTALDRIDGVSFIEDAAGPRRVYDDQLGVSVTANNWLVLDAETGKELYSYRPDEARPIASISKLMTALVFLETDPDLGKIIIIKEGDRVGGSSRRLDPGEEVKILDVLHTALIASDNDAAQLLQRISGKTEEEFVRAMNAKAATLGMYHSLFREPTGLNSENVASSRDAILLLSAALQNKIISEILQKPSYDFEVTEGGAVRTVHLYSTNHLQGSAYDIVGGKTGYIDESGYCLIVKVHGENGHPYFISVLGSDSIEDRFQDVKMLIEWVDRHYIWN